MDAERAQTAAGLWPSAIRRCYEMADELPRWRFVRRFMLRWRARRIESFIRRRPRDALDFALRFLDVHEAHQARRKAQ